MKWLGCCVYSVQLDNTGDRLWSYVSAGVTTASFHYSAPVKLINCKIPPTSFDLVTTSGLPASMMLFQLSYRGCVVFGLVASVKRPKWNNTGNPFRSSDLGVMSPARCLCAMPVKRNDIDSEFRSHDLPNKLSEVFHWYMSTPLRLVSSLTSHFFKTAKEENTGGRFRSYDLPLIRR